MFLGYVSPVEFELSTEDARAAHIRDRTRVPTSGAVHVLQESLGVSVLLDIYLLQGEDRP
jgi:hypothetical protein